MRIRPARRITGALSLPGDKAISHRAAIVAALARGQSHIENFSTGDDCAATISCLKGLGVSAEMEAGGLLRIEGAGLEGLRAPRQPLDCGNSGSTIRMLAGVLAGQNFESTLTGDESLRLRPMKRVIEPLELMGARVESFEGRAPLLITGRVPLKAISYEMAVASAQVKSCVLLAGLYAKERTSVIEVGGRRTRDHTERMLRWYGAQVTEREGDDASSNIITLEPEAQLKARDFRIPGDISSAAFFIAAACLLPGSNLRIRGAGLNPTRTTFLSTLRALGADVRAEQSSDSRGRWVELDEPSGDITVRGGAGLAPAKQEANLLSGSLIPQLIDELPMLAVLGTQVTGGLEIREASELRLKETDRIAATVENLRAMGAAVEEHEDGLTIPERARLRGAKINAHDDHRIAMAFSIAALLAEGESEIEGAECVSVSFPEFYRLLDSVTER
jgi:3-phosphoshikimate 1-carboxyvinyltransferase